MFDTSALVFAVAEAPDADLMSMSQATLNLLCRQCVKRGCRRFQDYKVNLIGFHVPVLTCSYFGNSAEEFHPHEDETLSILIKLLSSLSSSIQCHVSVFNVYEIL